MGGDERLQPDEMPTMPTDPSKVKVDVEDDYMGPTPAEKRFLMEERWAHDLLLSLNISLLITRSNTFVDFDNRLIIISFGG